MNLKHTLLATSLALAAGTLALAPAAFAADGTITINGQIVAQTCTVSLNGGANAGTGTVTLPPVTTAPFTAAGKTAGAMPFTISVSGCDSTLNGKTMTPFFSGSNIDAATGYLSQSGGTATNIEVALANSAAGTPFTLNKGEDNQGVTGTAVASGAASASYVAEYIQPAAATPTTGTVATSVSFTLVYE